MPRLSGWITAAVLASFSFSIAPIARAGDLVVGFVYSGPMEDAGFNQSHVDAAAGIKQIPGVKVLEQDGVLATDVQATMQHMIRDQGANLVFLTDPAYPDSQLAQFAAKNNTTLFFHCGGAPTPQDPPNLGHYFGYMDQCEYLCGIVAGDMTRNNKLAFVAADRTPRIVRDVNAFELGALSVNSNATTSVIFVGDASTPQRAADAANLLIDQGADVLASDIDRPKTILETAEHRGVYSAGYQINGSTFAPKGFLTGAQWNWSKVYADYVNDVQNNAMSPEGAWDHVILGGLREGVVHLTPYGPAVSERARRDADAAFSRLVLADFAIFKGPLKDSKGNAVISAGVTLDEKAAAVQRMDYLVDGVKDLTPLK